MDFAVSFLSVPAKSIMLQKIKRLFLGMSFTTRDRNKEKKRKKNSGHEMDSSNTGQPRSGMEKTTKWLPDRPVIITSPGLAFLVPINFGFQD